MASLNKCQFIGNLGAEPEVRSMSNGGQVASLRLACSESWKDREGNRQERTESIPVTIFAEHLVKLTQYLRKGSKVYVSGKFQTRKWQDQSGADRYSTEVVLQPHDGEMLLLDPKPRGQGEGGGFLNDARHGGGGGVTHRQPAPAFDTDLDDDVPFVTCDERLEHRMR